MPEGMLSCRRVLTCVISGRHDRCPGTVATRRHRDCIHTLVQRNRTSFDGSCCHCSNIAQIGPDDGQYFARRRGGHMDRRKGALTAGGKQIGIQLTPRWHVAKCFLQQGSELVRA